MQLRRKLDYQFKGLQVFEKGKRIATEESPPSCYLQLILTYEGTAGLFAIR